jgi:chromosome segregation ATPase
MTRCNRRMTGRTVMTVLGAAALAASAPALAQVERSGGGGEAQRIMQQYQQVSSEKVALQGQLAQAKKDLDAAHSDLAAMNKERDALKAQSGNAAAQTQKLTESKDAAEKALAQYQQRMNELVARFRETAGNLKDVEADRAKLRQSLDERNRAYDKCASDNLELYEINGEILDRYEHVGFFTKASASQPFVSITRDRISNLVEEYRERALQLRLEKKSTP